MLRVILSLLVGLTLASCGDAPEAPLESPMRGRPAPEQADVPPPPGLIAEGAAWETLAEGYIYSEGPAAAPDGAVYYAEPVFNHLYKIDPEGAVTQLDTNTSMTMGLVMGADGYIYACRNRAAQIVRYSTQGSHEVLLQGEMTPLKNNPQAPGEFCNDLAVNADGGIWFTDRINQQVIYLAADGTARTVADGFRGNGIVLSADRKMIVVTDSNNPVLHAFMVGENGSLTEVPEFFDAVRTLDRIDEQGNVTDERPGTDGMTVDSDGRFYVASFYGIQVFGPDGKYIGSLQRPNEFTSNLTFGGPGYGWLYATGREGIFRLQMQTRGVGW